MRHATTNRVAQGKVFPELATLAQLETALKTDLYPSGWWKTDV